MGMAVGWPLVQCQLIVSTLWGIVYYKVGLYELNAVDP
jgi:hypothetical protein